MQDGRDRAFAIRRGLSRQAVAWVAVLCVYVQLAAAALCTAGAPANAGPFPICHAQAQADIGHPDDRAPSTPDHHCPFCAVHCHATAALAPTPAHIARPAIAAVVIERPAFAVHATPRVVAGASPRGPPAAA